MFLFSLIHELLIWIIIYDLYIPSFVNLIDFRFESYLGFFIFLDEISKFWQFLVLFLFFNL